MIKTKKELKEFLEADKKALGVKFTHPRFMTDFEWKYEIALRKAEYYSNSKNIFFKLFSLFHLRRLQLKYQTFIPMNVCDKGLAIAHIGGIRINSNARLGKFVRIQEGVTIGATNGSTKAPIIGNFVYIGSGAKIIGNIFVVDNSCIGAGAVVIKNILECGTYCGCPAIMKNKNDSSSNLLCRFDE